MTKRCRQEGHASAYHTFTHDEVPVVRANLLSWFDTHRRCLPWRGDKPPYDNPSPGRSLPSDAYAVWVSEVMLQQTRVDTVIPYYERWMKRFPSIADLASASMEDVNEMWAGLGYYRRARFLLEGAQWAMKECGGLLPTSVPGLKKVPGIGEYTAGAIASIAFGQRVPLVDGNVVRVLSRVRAIAAAPNASNALKLHWALAGDIVDYERPGDFNQALMELGATVCTQHNPSCSACPIESICLARQEGFCCAEGDIPDPVGVVTRYPLKKLKQRVTEQSTRVCCVESDGRVLLVKRACKGLLAGQWAFPCWERFGDQLDRALTDDSALAVHRGIGPVQHIFTHIRMTIDITYARFPSDPAVTSGTDTETRWVPVADFDNAKLTTGVRKVWQAVRRHLSARRQTSITTFVRHI
ncbi:unnamed protein product (mitochondrion) [Plasmodiophora brassicae]|uniref:Adenine DNA glycosylase n=1 Tax=Plasmodiophora brassicae TaxID=37360 RepID=A0A3P3Y7D4_PLABS|nr:unnamed protein product [Plasmodiophora brassicae]